MQWLEDALNWLSDQDWGWWPMLFLRPQKHEKMTFSRILKIAVYYGTLGAVFAGIPLTMRYQRCGCLWFDNAPLTFLAIAFYMYAGIFIWCKFLSAIAWNRRAARLQKQKRKPDEAIEFEQV